MVKRLVADPAFGGARLDRLKSIVCGGGPLYVADAKATFAAFGPRLAQIYGQGESPMTITAMSRAHVADAIARGDDARLGSVGIAQAGMEVRVGDADDRAMPAGEIGEVLVRGPAVMQGYWMDAKASRRALANGWLHTGDVGSLDGDGYLTLTDRRRISSSAAARTSIPGKSRRIPPLHPGVAEVAVIGRPHAEWGEEVIACVVARGGPPATAEARHGLLRSLDALCLDHIARFKRPKDYVFRDALPKNNAGKVLKTELRRKLSAR